MSVGLRVEPPGLVVALHQTQTVALTDKGDLLTRVEGDGPVEVPECFPQLLGLEVEFTPVDVGFVVLGEESDALFELCEATLTIC